MPIPNRMRGWAGRTGPAALICACALTATLYSGCTSSTAPTEEGSAEAAKGFRAPGQGLQLVEGSLKKAVWLHPDANLGRYSSGTIEDMVVEYRHEPTKTRVGSSHVGVRFGERDLDRVQRIFGESFAAELAGNGNFQIATSNELPALRFSPSLTDVVMLPHDRPNRRATHHQTTWEHRYRVVTRDAFLVLARNGIEPEALVAGRERALERTPGRQRDHIQSALTIPEFESDGVAMASRLRSPSRIGRASRRT